MRVKEVSPTGRLVSKDLRAALVISPIRRLPPDVSPKTPRVFMQVDYAGLELRIMAHVFTQKGG